RPGRGGRVGDRGRGCPQPGPGRAARGTGAAAARCPVRPALLRRRGQGGARLRVPGLPDARGEARQPPRRDGGARAPRARFRHAGGTTSRARLVFPALRWRGGSFDHERAKIDAALAAGVGGFIIFGGTPASVGALTRDLRQGAGRPLLIGADLERGVAQQVPGMTELPTAAALGLLDDLEATRTAGIITASEARALGINWAFGPVCDLDLEPKNPIIQTRSFGTEPLRVGEHAAAWVEGLQQHGVLGCAKHYPGHGRTLRDSHETLPRVTTPRAAPRAVGTAIPQARADEALAHGDKAAVQWGGGADQGEPDLAAHGAFADGLADRALLVHRADPPLLRGPLGVHVVDDDVGGPYTVGP